MGTFIFAVLKVILISGVGCLKEKEKEAGNMKKKTKKKKRKREKMNKKMKKKEKRQKCDCFDLCGKESLFFPPLSLARSLARSPHINHQGRSANVS